MLADRRPAWRGVVGEGLAAVAARAVSSAISKSSS